MNPFEKWSVWGTSIAVLVTGVLYGWMKYFMSPLEPWAVINHPLQPWVLKAHIITAPLLVFAVGLVTVRHIWLHYCCRVPLGRKSGIVTALVTAPMIVTGYLIQAITHLGWIKAMAIAHVGFGLIYGLGLAAHQIAVQRRKRGSIVGRAKPAAPRARTQTPQRAA